MANVAFTANTSNIQHNGNPAAYVEQIFSVALTFDLSGTFLTDIVTLTVTLELPGYSSDEQVCSNVTLIDGLQTPTVCSRVQTFHPLTSTPGLGNIQTANGTDIVLLEPPDIYATDGNVTLEFTVLNVTGANDSITVTLQSIEFLDIWRQEINNTFTAHVLATYDDNGTEVTLSDETTTLDVSVIGADLRFIINDNVPALQAGDSVTVAIRCQHSTRSTETAQNVEVRTVQCHYDAVNFLQILTNSSTVKPLV